MREINSKEAPNAVGPYSQAIDVGDFVFLSGQIAINPEDNSFDKNNSIEKQTKIVLENLKNVLKEANLSFSDVVKAEIFLTNMDDFKIVNDIYKKYFSHEITPARQTVGVHSLPLGAKIEISCIAKR